MEKYRKWLAYKYIDGELGGRISPVPTKPVPLMIIRHVSSYSTAANAVNISRKTKIRKPTSTQKTKIKYSTDAFASLSHSCCFNSFSTISNYNGKEWEKTKSEE